MNDFDNDRLILAIKHHAKSQPGLGAIVPVAEIRNSTLIGLHEGNFCSTGLVFIPVKYEEIDNKFRENELFKIRVSLNTVVSEKTTNPCIYKAPGNLAEKVGASEICELIHAELPDKNSKILYCGFIPSTPYIFLQNEHGECFGPFDWILENPNEPHLSGVILKFITGGGFGAVGSKKQIFQVSQKNAENKIIRCTLINQERNFILSAQNFISGSTYFDYASDRDIIEYIKSKSNDNLVNKSTWQKLIPIIQKSDFNSKSNDLQLTKNRTPRFLELINDIYSQQDFVQHEIHEYLEHYFKTDSGKNVLESHIQAHKSQYLSQFKNEKFTDINRALEVQQNEIKRGQIALVEQRKELNDLIEQILRKRDELEKEAKKKQADISAKLEAEMKAELKNLEIEYDEYRRKILELQSLHQVYADLENVKKEVIKKRDELKFTQELQTQTARELAKDENELRKRLLDLKPYVEHINTALGNHVQHTIELPDISIPQTYIQAEESILLSQQHIIQTIQYALSKKNRFLETWEIANILICIQQSFVTFLAGLPGVGKTSLSRLFADVQGSSSRLCEISVARGWTSTKDIIGFHNPLSDQFQTANTGLYPFLLALDQESKTVNDPSIAYILLDEANLSPIEHYWSAFMGMTDWNGKNELKLGTRTISIPHYLRFLGTINYDGTTEPLSSRIIDRAPILVLDTDKNLEDQIYLVQQNLLQLPLTHQQMERLFGRFQETPQLRLKEQVIFEDIQRILLDPNPELGRPIHISQRKIVAIRQYCERARPIMEAESNYLTGLDLAILQHVLPQVRGHGQKFAHRLEKLLEVLSGHALEKTVKYLKQMIAYGQSDLHSYDFFCW
jgi:MoxR-like ATPase